MKDPMTIRSRLAIPCLTLALIGCSSAPTQSGTPSSSAVAVHAVVDSFRTAIVNKDKAMFMGLFFSEKPEEITWQAVVDDASLQYIKATRPQAIKARRRPDNNFVAFIDGVLASKEPHEEKFWDIQVDTDGEVASASFDYAYLVSGKATNSGREKWLLVRTEAGWKITSVVYTIRLPNVKAGP